MVTAAIANVAIIIIITTIVIVIIITTTSSNNNNVINCESGRVQCSLVSSAMPLAQFRLNPPNLSPFAEPLRNLRGTVGQAVCEISKKIVKAFCRDLVLSVASGIQQGQRTDPTQTVRFWIIRKIELLISIAATTTAAMPMTRTTTTATTATTTTATTTGGSIFSVVERATCVSRGDGKRDLARMECLVFSPRPKPLNLKCWG